LTDSAKDILRRMIDHRRNSTIEKEGIITLLKGARYLYYVSVTGTVLGVVWYFISGEFHNPQMTVGSGIYQQDPAWNTYSGIITAAIFAIIFYAGWKAVLPWQERKLREDKERIEKECEILERSFLEDGEGKEVD